VGRIASFDERTESEWEPKEKRGNSHCAGSRASALVWLLRRAGHEKKLSSFRRSRKPWSRQESFSTLPGCEWARRRTAKGSTDPSDRGSTSHYHAVWVSALFQGFQNLMLRVRYPVVA